MRGRNLDRVEVYPDLLVDGRHHPIRHVVKVPLGKFDHGRYRGKESLCSSVGVRLHS